MWPLAGLTWKDWATASEAARTTAATARILANPIMRGSSDGLSGDRLATAAGLAFQAEIGVRSPPET